MKSQPNNKANQPRNILSRLSISLFFLILASVPTATAFAQTLYEALTQTYLNNPALAAARAQLQAIRQKIPQALSGWQPSLSIEGSVARQYREVDLPKLNSVDQTSYPWEAKITLVQPLYRGGRTVAATNQAKNLVLAQESDFKATEQSVLLDAVTAYMNVVRDQAILELTRNNEQVINKQLSASRDRYNAGEITQTDVALSESRLSSATAQRIRAEGNLAISKAVFARVIGQEPKNLRAPSVPKNMPKTQQQVVQGAMNNPFVTMFTYLEKASHDAVDLSFGEMLPTISLIGSYGIQQDDIRGDGRGGKYQTGVIMAQISIPLYQGGLAQSRLRESKLVVSQRLQELRSQREIAVQNAISAWQGLESVRAQIKAYESQVRAAKIALEGVRQEAAVGSRTLLDSLDAEQEYLDAQVSLVIAKRDEIVAAYMVLSSIGQLTLDDLNIQVK